MKQVQKSRDTRKDEIFDAIQRLGKVGIYRIAKAIGMSRSKHLESIVKEMVQDGELEMIKEPYRGAIPYRTVFRIHRGLAS